tara:strand:- start:161 stop:832 length:672 start_codon:yes stop_codon:yes gene_type:complete
MTHFLDSIGGRQLTIITDGFTTTEVLDNGDTSYQEDGLQSRAYRAVDSGAGAYIDYLPHWGTDDWTFFALMKASSSLNPTGFPNYNFTAATDTGYNNPRFAAYATGSYKPQFALYGAGASPTMAFLMQIANNERLCMWRVESSNLAGGVHDGLMDGRKSTAPVGHGCTTVPASQTTYFQWGGRSGASDFGVLNMRLFSKVGFVHSWVSDETAALMAEEMGTYK